MKIAIMFITLLTTLFPSIVYSGEIFGCIKLGKKFIGKGVTIEIKPEDKTQLIEIIETDVNLLKIKNPIQTVETQPKPIGTTKTDECGIYSIYLDREGKHIINMSYEENGEKQFIYFMKEHNRDIAVYLSDESVQYDFIIEENKDGKYFAKIK